MISMNYILTYIKNMLGINFDIIEISDEKLQQHISTYTLKTFSTYVPDVQEFQIDTIHQRKYNNREDAIYIDLPPHLQERDILNIVHVTPSSFDYVLFGHDPVGLSSFESLPDRMMNNIQQSAQYKHSVFNFIFKFKHPNILIMRPMKKDSKLHIEQELTHEKDLSTIPDSYIEYFQDLCLQDVKIMLGNIRRKYQNLSTPWLQVNIDQSIGQEGQQEKREILDKLRQSDILSNVIIDFD